MAGRFCGSCRNLHALWPYIRLSRSSTGLERSGSVLEAALRAFITQGLRKILIAGAADTGLLSLVLRAADDFDVDVTVIDVCASPLELCRRLAGQWSIPVRTVKQDLANLDERQEFDLVLVHGTLHFIAGEKRLNVLARIHRALRPNGRLVLLFNTSRPSTIGTDDKLHVDYAESVVKELRRLAIPLPELRIGIYPQTVRSFSSTSGAGRRLCQPWRCRASARDGWVRDYRLQRGRDDTFSTNVHGTHFEASLHGDRGAEVFDVRPFNDGRT